MLELPALVPAGLVEAGDVPDGQAHGLLEAVVRDRQRRGGEDDARHGPAQLPGGGPLTRHAKNGVASFSLKLQDDQGRRLGMQKLASYLLKRPL